MQPAGGEETIAVPVSAIVHVGTNDFVFINYGESYTKRQVVTGRRDDRYVEIIKGLDVGDGVVSAGAQKLQAMIGTDASEPK